MWKSLVALFVRLVNLFLDKKQKEKEPLNVELKEKKEFDEAVVKGDANTVTRIINERLQRAKAKERVGNSSK